MHIKEVILDGFKSYARRTVISGFDSQFNAITGLNGSGKSNILDAICFVLGISNLSKVRVTSMRQLIYKGGDAGITKASVSVVFDNSDKAGSPVGYDQHDSITVTRQITADGRTKYMVNGRTAQQKQVTNLFHSVGLNVDNPHFLIQQGLITKVLNMKPLQILGLVEEAAGTRMFETNRQKAVKTIDKKQGQVNEIDKNLTEDITPKLESLRQQQADLRDFNATQQEVERKRRLVVAYDYWRVSKEVTEADTRLGDLRRRVEEAESRAREANEAAAVAARAEEEANSFVEQHMADGFQELEDRESGLGKEVVKQNTAWQNAKEAADRARKDVDKLRQQLADLEHDYAARREAAKDKAEESQRCTEEAAEARATVERLETQLTGVTAGIASGDADATGGGKSLQAERQEAEEQRAEASAEEHRHALRLKQLAKERKAAEKAVKKAGKGDAKLTKRLDAAEEALAEARRAVEACPQPDAARERDVREQRGKAAMRAAAARDKASRLEARLGAAVRFEYKDPEPGFDRSRVKGVLARLVRAQESGTTTALEVSAGGSLFHVVVDTEKTGKALLQRGQLRRRVTLAPLNRLASRALEGAKVERAQRIATEHGGEARLAMSLVGYDAEIERAVEHVFGSTIICSSMDVAKAVTFDPAVRCRTVTTDGDSFDPRGTLEGGSAPNRGGSILATLATLREAEEEAAAADAQLKQLEEELATLVAAQREATKAQRELGTREREAAKLRRDVAQSEAGRLRLRVGELEAECAEVEKARAEAETRAAEAAERGETLSRRAEDLAANRDQQVRDVERRLEEARKASATASAKAAEASQEADEAVLGDQAEAEEREALEVAAEQAGKRCDAAEAEAERLRAAAAEARTAFDEAKAQVTAQREELATRQRGLRELRRNREQAQEQARGRKKAAHEAREELREAEAGMADKRTFLEDQEEEHPWLASDRALLGVAGTDYDFEARNAAGAKQALPRLQQRLAQMGRRVNRKVLGMMEQAERDHTDLMSKRRIIETDKSKIEHVMNRLVEKKNRALQQTWERVNKHFASIFSTLLPGAEACLAPPEGGTLLGDGLEVRVAFGGAWKESLSELSGGQRSLLALSLVLALLLFKPAPMYILDEVDAALDLSHTQNIGRMLRRHFAQSQFVVVSLKEGMFNNANIIFRTKLVEGASTVSRTAVRAGAQAENGTAPAAKGKGAARRRGAGAAATATA